MSLPRSLVRRLGVALPSALALTVVGCTPGDASRSHEQLGAETQSIRGGYADTDDTGVVGIYDLAVGGMCSGSLIAPNVVLTARHCVSDISEQVECGRARPGGVHAADNFYVTTRASLNSQNPADYHKVRDVIGLPLDATSADPILNKEDLCGRDQAILVLADNIPASEATPYVPRVDSELEKGDEYYAVGFGATDDAGNQAGIRRRRDDLFVSCVGGECPAEYVKSTEFVGDTGICQGDSGGPAIDMQNRVVGVTSRGGFGCDSPVYGHVFGWGQWIKDVVNYAAQASVGNYPAPSWASGKSTDPAFGGAVGGPCDAAECTSTICVNTGTPLGDYCSHKCDAINTCPDGFECSADRGVCTEKATPESASNPAPGGAVSGSNGPGSEDDLDSVEAGCSVASLDPTKPVPWRTGAVFLGALGAVFARRRRSS